VARASAFLSVDTAFMHIAAATRVRHQCVIETPTLNPPVEPLRSDWVRIPNPAVGGRSLDFYRYDGRPIEGTPDELTRIMQSVTPEAVADHVLRGFARF
jgi:ADP-heptose:LPS heptosyltransferase